METHLTVHQATYVTYNLEVFKDALTHDRKLNTREDWLLACSVKVISYILQSLAEANTVTGAFFRCSVGTQLGVMGTPAALEHPNTHGCFYVKGEMHLSSIYGELQQSPGVLLNIFMRPFHPIRVLKGVVHRDHKEDSFGLPPLTNKG